MAHGIITQRNVYHFLIHTSGILVNKHTSNCATILKTGLSQKKAWACAFGVLIIWGLEKRNSTTP